MQRTGTETAPVASMSKDGSGPMCRGTKQGGLDEVSQAGQRDKLRQGLMRSAVRLQVLPLPPTAASRFVHRSFDGADTIPRQAEDAQARSGSSRKCMEPFFGDEGSISRRSLSHHAAPAAPTVPVEISAAQLPASRKDQNRARRLRDVPRLLLGYRQDQEEWRLHPLQRLHAVRTEWSAEGLGLAEGPRPRLVDFPPFTTLLSVFCQHLFG